MNEIKPQVIEISTADFAEQVLQNAEPVIVNFWSPQVQECVPFSAALEQAVASHPKIQLAKMNVDEHPEVAMQLQIQALPFAMAFHAGKPVEATNNENEIISFVNKIAALAGGADPQLEAALAQAESFAAENNHAQAAEIFSAILNQMPNCEPAFLGLGNAWLALNEIEKIKTMLAQATPEQKELPAFKTIEKAVQLAEQAEGLDDLETLRKACEAQPKNYQAKFDYALGLNAAGQRIEASEQLLEIIQKNKAWENEKARLQLLDFFQTWGHSDEATIKARRKLSGILFS